MEPYDTRLQDILEGELSDPRTITDPELPSSSNGSQNDDLIEVLAHHRQQGTMDLLINSTGKTIQITTEAVSIINCTGFPPGPITKKNFVGVKPVGVRHPIRGRYANSSYRLVDISALQFKFIGGKMRGGQLRNCKLVDCVIMEETENGSDADIEDASDADNEDKDMTVNEKMTPMPRVSNRRIMINPSTVDTEVTEATATPASTSSMLSSGYHPSDVSMSSDNLSPAFRTRNAHNRPPPRAPPPPDPLAHLSSTVRTLLAPGSLNLDDLWKQKTLDVNTHEFSSPKTRSRSIEPSPPKGKRAGHRRRTASLDTKAARAMRKLTRNTKKEKKDKIKEGAEDDDKSMKEQMAKDARASRAALRDMKRQSLSRYCGGVTVKNEQNRGSDNPFGSGMDVNASLGGSGPGDSVKGATEDDEAPFFMTLQGYKEAYRMGYVKLEEIPTAIQAQMDLLPASPVTQASNTQGHVSNTPRQPGRPRGTGSGRKLATPRPRGRPRKVILESPEAEDDMVTSDLYAPPANNGTPPEQKVGHDDEDYIMSGFKSTASLISKGD